MINQHKWIKSLPKTNIKFNEEENQADHSRWLNTIPQKNTYNSVAWKYPFAFGVGKWACERSMMRSL